VYAGAYARFFLATLAVLAPLVLTAHHGHPTVLGWALETLGLAGFGVWQVRRGLQRRQARRDGSIWSGRTRY
jgi:hypothetical protein